jgi:hypothetical protein
MPDPLYLSMWFPQFSERDMMSRTTSVLRQFPFSAQRPGITQVAIHPVSWSEPTVLERRFRPGLDEDQATAIASEFAHPDYAYVFEAYWDLWVPEENKLILSPEQVQVIAHGLEFDDGAYQQAGHIQVDLGLDEPFLFETPDEDEGAEARIRANVQKLVGFTQAVEKNCGISGRVLWSESDENLAQKLIERVQRVH